jgi:serine/threonine-protein kinase
MALALGARIGPYEVVGSLGAGGMGEVYRARDTRLHRDVALKVLPEAFESNPERIARFEREAQVLASLNHPHIAAIYGLEEGSAERLPGQSGVVPAGGRTFRALVLELVDGSTLADRIRLGPVPLDEALTIAGQIADALDAAHQRGIVHRDLKPANIKIAPGGAVKVLDFGLAKLVEAGTAGGASESQGLSESPTVLSPTRMTGIGVVLGTAAYMSPEQAKGREADRRSDVWAFGCVLFEMLSGRRAFDGDDVSDTIAAVLRSEPDWTLLPGTTPASVRRLIRRCLRRDPLRRTRDIGDVRLDLEEAASEPALAPGRARPRDADRSRRWTRVAPWALVPALAALSVSLFVQSRQTPSSSRSVGRVEMNMPPGVELYTLSGGVGVSPDGSRVAFIGIVSAVRRVYVRRFDSFEAEPLRGTETASWCCSFSPDGEGLAFITADGTVRKVSLSDGLVTTVASNAERSGAHWLSNEVAVFLRGGTLWSVGASGGEPTRLLPEEDLRQYRWPIALPGGRVVVFASVVVGRDADSRIESFDLGTGERKVLVERGTLPRYAPSGHLVFYRDGELLAAAFDTGALRVTGSSVRILENLPATGAGVPLVDVSAGGVLVYAPTTAAARLVWVSRRGAEQPLSDTPRIYANPRLDPKGRWVLVQTTELWVHDLVRTSFSLLSTGPVAAGSAFPALTPDGSTVVFRTGPGLGWQALDGSGRGGTIEGTGPNDYPGSISPDGKQLVFVRISPDTSGDIYVAALEGSSDARPVVQTSGYDGSARLSPDGRWLLYTSDESGQYEVYLRRFGESGGRLTVSTQGGSQPLWNPSGREIFYRSGDKMMAVGVSLGDEPTLSEPTQLFEQRYAFGGGLTIPNYDVSADGQRFVMVKEESNASRLNLVVNWFDELRARAPSSPEP